MARELDQESLLQLRAALIRQAHRQLRDRHEAEDVAQDALLALCTTSVQFTDLDHIAAYARRTVHNLCVDRIRRRVRHVHLEHAEGSYDSLERDVINRDLIAAVVSGLSEINPVYAQVIVASTEVGRDHTAIAALTGVSLRNVRHGLDRGASALRARLAAAGHSIPGVLVPLPLRALLAAVKSAIPRRGRAVAGAVLAGVIPALVLLLPNVLSPFANSPQVGLGKNGSAVAFTPSSRLQGAAPSPGRQVAGLGDPVNDRAFAADAARLLGTTQRLHPNSCYMAAGHGICQGDPDPRHRYYTVKVPANPYVPDLQVWADYLPPCDSTVPTNPVLDCEYAYPPVPFPIPTGRAQP